MSYITIFFYNNSGYDQIMIKTFNSANEPLSIISLQENNRISVIIRHNDIVLVIGENHEHMTTLISEIDEDNQAFLHADGCNQINSLSREYAINNYGATRSADFYFEITPINEGERPESNIELEDLDEESDPEIPDVMEIDTDDER